MKPEGEICVDVSKGCALLINSKHFKEVSGYFQKNFFYFGKKLIYVKNF